MRTRALRVPPRQRVLLACLLSALLVTLVGCSRGSADPTNGTQPPGVGQVKNVPSAPPSGLTYVALGDSYSAAPLVPVTDVANGCFRSSNNYPSIVAKRLGAKLDDRSCGGARTQDFTRSQFPGVPAQLTAVKPSTDLVTVGIGGNDESVFGQLVGRCPALRHTDPTGSPCRTAMESAGSDKLLSALRRTGVHVTALLRQIHAKAPKAQVLVVGYPQIVDPAHVCAELPLARGDYAYAEQVAFALTQMLRRAAAATGSTYVDVWKASKNHDICASDPWINGSVNDEKRAARYHPFAAEQLAVAGLVLQDMKKS